MTFPIPRQALESHIAILGKTGSGKTVAAKGMVERILDARGRACAIDPTGVWHGLRSSADGKTAGYPVVIFGGPHADVPLAQTHGEAIAEIVGNSSTSAVIDTSLMRVSERTRFFADFGDALIRKNKGPLHLVIDEAHLFMPQGRVADPWSAQMLHAANNLVSLGRSRGLRITIISQRPAKVHKDALTQAETLIAMRLIAPQDRNAVEAWIEDNADDSKAKEIISSLATLKTGEAWLWAPELGVLERIKFSKNKTFDSSRAPDASEGEGPVLAPINLKRVHEKLAALEEEAKANDPKLLKAEVARLTRELSSESRIDTDDLKRARAEGATEAYRLGFREGWRRGWDSGCAKGIDEMTERVRRIESPVLLAPPAPELTIPTDEAFTSPAESGFRKTPVEHKQIPQDRTRSAEFQRTSSQVDQIAENGNSRTGGAEQRILDGLRELEVMGVESASRVLCAFMANYSHLNSKGFVNAIGALRSAGLVEYPGSSSVRLTSAGREKAAPKATPATTRDIQDRIVSLLGGASGRILAPLIEVYPRALVREHVAAKAGYRHLNSKGFVNAIGRLRTLGFVDYPSRGEVRATDLLFPGRRA